MNLVAPSRDKSTELATSGHIWPQLATKSQTIHSPVRFMVLPCYPWKLGAKGAEASGCYGLTLRKSLRHCDSFYSQSVKQQLYDTSCNPKCIFSQKSVYFFVMYTQTLGPLACNSKFALDHTLVFDRGWLLGHGFVAVSGAAQPQRLHYPCTGL